MNYLSVIGLEKQEIKNLKRLKEERIITKEEIYQLANDNTIKILPGIIPEMITIDERLKDLGANSIDRMEIVTMTMESLGIKIPLVEFGKAENIEGLINLFYEKKKVLKN